MGQWKNGLKRHLLDKSFGHVCIPGCLSFNRAISRTCSRSLLDWYSVWI